MTKDVPKRKIVKTTKRIGKYRRYRLLAWLECGHVEPCNVFESNRGSIVCFDCYYEKPKHWDGETR
jgi:hypothetical protein